VIRWLRLVRLFRLLLHAEGAGQRTHRVDVPNFHADWFTF
jgi:hypothetical protein